MSRGCENAWDICDSREPVTSDSCDMGEVLMCDCGDPVSWFIGDGTKEGGCTGPVVKGSIRPWTPSNLAVSDQLTMRSQVYNVLKLH